MLVLIKEIIRTSKVLKVPILKCHKSGTTIAQMLIV